MAQTQVTTPYQAGHDYGIGADLASGSPMGLAVNPTPSGVPGAEGGDLRFYITRITSTQDVEEKLGISAELSAGCGVFGASARFEFAKSCKVHAESLFIGIHANTRLAFESIDDPVLTDHAAELAPDPDRFHSRYGTMFVRGIARGGLFVAVLQIEASSTEQASAINGELQGAFGLFGAEGSVAIQETISRHNVGASALVYAEGGSKAELAPYVSRALDPGKVIAASEVWLRTVQENPVPYQVTLAPLSIARGAPEPPNVIELQEAQDVIMHCAHLRSILLDGLNALTYVAAHPDRYAVTASADGTDLGALQNRFGKALDLVAEAARDAMRDPKAAKEPEVYFAEQGITMPSIPADLYSAVAADTVSVPDLSDTTSWQQCVDRLQAVGLSANQVFAENEPVGPFAVLATAPVAGAKIEKGSPITVTVRPPDMTGMVKVLDPRMATAILSLKPNG